MADIFAGIRNGRDSDLRSIIALLETVTLSRLAAIGKDNACDSLARAANRAGSFFGSRRKIDLAAPRDLPALLREKEQELAPYSREQLEFRLKISLADRLGVKLSGADDEEKLTAALVAKAAKHFKITENLTPAQLADAVATRCIERIIASANEKISQLAPKDETRMIQRYDEAISTLDENQKQALRRALRLDEVTGEAIHNALIGSGLAALPAACVGIGGFGSYIALSVIMHAIATTTFGLTLPFAVYTGAAST